MTRFYERADSEIVAIASAAISGDGLSAESSVINRESGGNADGAFAYHLFAEVVSDQSALGGNTILELYHAAYDPNSTKYATEGDVYGDYSLHKEVPNTDGSTTSFVVDVGIHIPNSTREKFKLKAADYDITCNLVIIPIYVADV